MTTLFSKKWWLGSLAVAFFASVLAASEPLEKLILSNSPERITVPGTILNQITDATPFRVFYHHKNDSGSLMFVRLSLYNPLNAEVAITAITALGGPDPDEIFTGHQSAKRFFEELDKKQTPIKIKPQETLVLVYHPIKPTMVSTGLIRISGQPEGLHLKLEIIDPLYEHLSALNEEETPFRFLEWSDGRRKISKTLDLRIPIDSLRIGEAGDYGVLYDAELKLNNPTPGPKQVKIFFSPAGGIARGVFLWDDSLMDTLVVHPKGETLTVKSIIVAPFEFKTIRLITMPEAGSYYPVDMVFQSKDHAIIGDR